MDIVQQFCLSNQLAPMVQSAISSSKFPLPSSTLSIGYIIAGSYVDVSILTSSRMFTASRE